MGFGKGAIILDSPTGAYFSGQTVNGRLEFELQNKIKIRGISLSVKGFCSVSWTTQHSRRVNDRTEHYSVEHSSYEEYISLRLQLVGGKNSEKHLDPGKFEYPFSFQLPPNCPSSVDGSVGHVRYEVDAVMDIPYAVDKTITRKFRVLAPFDLNTINCKDPGVIEIDQTYCCWCCTSGISETLVKIPVRGYCASQPLPVEVSCKNRSTVEIDEIAFKVKKIINTFAFFIKFVYRNTMHHTGPVRIPALS
ncbi:hypothetical protein evm_005995 [Chilo suppressalis]|nr:hypothetical protein evm_005995 [Chilo suppressalis]